MLHGGVSFFLESWIFIIFFFSPPYLGRRLADRHQTLPHVRQWPRFIKLGQKFGGPLQYLVVPLKYLVAQKWQKHQSDFRHLRLQTGTRHRRSENGVASRDHSRIIMIVKFGEFWSTNGENSTVVLTYPKITFWTLISEGPRGIAP